MAANPVLAFGAAAGLLWGAALYIRGRDIKRSLFSAVIVGLALGTPLHFLLLPGYAGWIANQQIHRLLNRNWTSFIVSLVGVPVFFGLLQATGKIMAESYSTGTVGGGGAIIIALGWGVFLAVLILAGCALYAVTSFAASYRRRAKANH
jgi:hypothetical protein